MTQPVIEKVTVQTVLVPINPPHRTASGLVDKSPLVLIELHCSGGLIGNAILFTYTPAALKSSAELVRGFAELLIGHTLSPRAINDFLVAKTRLIGSQGLVGTVLAGIDMAAWDALARHHEISVCRLLGGQHKPIMAYAGTGYDGELETARQAEAWVKKGYKAVKAKIGYPTAAEDLAVIRAMRAAVGPDVELMVDYNQSLKAVDAIQRLRTLDEEGLVDYVMPDVMKIGGVSGWLKAVDIASAAGKQVSSHLWPELSAQLLAIGSTSHRLEYVDWWAEILSEPLLVEEGMTVLPEDLRGSGVAFNREKIELYRV